MNNKKKYEPNFEDKRVKERIEKALFGVVVNLSLKKSKPWSHEAINHFFGESQLGNWLRDNLLICTDELYVPDTTKLKEYTYDPAVYTYLRKVLRGDRVPSFETYIKKNPKRVMYETKKDVVFDNKLINELVMRIYGKELNSMVFEYNDKSQRLWHPLQNIKKIHKKTIFARQGLLYNYDVEACAPTLLLQLAKHRGLDVYTPAMDLMLSEKKKVRKYLAESIGVDIKTVKFIVNALLCGAKLVKYNPYSRYDHAITKALNNDNDLIEKVKNNPYISLLRDEYKEMWGAIGTLEVRELRSNGTIKPLTSRHKWRVYFYQERKILDAVLRFCGDRSIKIFAEHDGFVANVPVNTNDLSDFVEMETGYRVTFSGEVLSPVLEASAIAEELIDGFTELEESEDDDSDQDDEEEQTTKKDHTWVIDHIKSM